MNAVETLETFPRLFAGGYELDRSPERLGLVGDSADILDDAEALRRRMAENGYLFLPGYLDRDLVLEARREMTQQLLEEGYLDPAYPPMEAVAAPGRGISFKPAVAQGNRPLHELLYSGRMIEFFGRFLGGAVRHFDYTWVRVKSPGRGTPSHCDIVYMGRGTTNLYTAWTPIGDIDYEMGGLMILEDSHRNQRLRETYGRSDVDTFCTNRPDQRDIKTRRGGHLTHNPLQIRKSLGGRWLTREYQAGDVLIFSMYTVHASLDNRSNRVRLSTDTRYQLASEPVDERWIGENPIAHSQAGKRGRVC